MTLDNTLTSRITAAWHHLAAPSLETLNYSLEDAFPDLPKRIACKAIDMLDWRDIGYARSNFVLELNLQEQPYYVGAMMLGLLDSSLPGNIREKLEICLSVLLEERDLIKLLSEDMLKVCLELLQLAESEGWTALPKRLGE